MSKKDKKMGKTKAKEVLLPEPEPVPHKKRRKGRTKGYCLEYRWREERVRELYCKNEWGWLKARCDWSPYPTRYETAKDRLNALRQFESDRLYEYRIPTEEDS